MGLVDEISSARQNVLHSRVLGEADYVSVWREMQVFTRQRNKNTPDEVWWVQHPPVFTLGRNGKMEHVLAAGDIPVIPIDRGGQVTYHGPGQLVAYLLLDIRRKNISVRDLVVRMEQAVIDLLANYGIAAEGKRDAPGVYVRGRKISALGLRVARGCTYHGLSLNVDMRLEPFQRINPCGHAGLQVTQCRDLGMMQTPFELVGELYACLVNRLDYSRGK